MQLPASLWHRWLRLQGRCCRFPQNGAFSRTFPGCLPCRNPDGSFHFSHTEKLEVTASLHGKAGKPLLASGRTEELWGIRDVLWMLWRAALPSSCAASCESGFVSDNSNESFQASFQCSSNTNPGCLYQGAMLKMTLWQR